MIPRPSRVVFAFIVLLLGAGSARAEVVARTDRLGNYVGTEIVTSDKRGAPVVWGASGRVTREGFVLNPEGDVNADLWPVVAESPFGAHHPWVVWSRFNGEDYDLVWSRWNGQDWQTVQPVVSEPTPGHDLDPSLTFDGNGRPQLTWSVDREGVSEVLYSTWRNRRWTTPLVVSEMGVDSRYPVIVGFGPGSVDIEYTTPDEVVVKRVVFSVPGTITDDINPMRHQRDAVIPVPVYTGPATARWEDR